MLTVIFGLSTALFFGSGDFLGGFASRRISPIRVTALSAAGGLVTVCLIVPLFGGTWTPAAIAWGAVAGIVACLSVSMLYASLAIGPMSILSPIIAILSALVPMTVGLVGGERFSALGYVGLALALLAVILVGLPSERHGPRPQLRGLVLAAGAGVSIGFGLVVFSQMPADSGFVPLIVGRTISVLVMFSAVGVLALRARRSRLRRPNFAGDLVESTGWRGGFWIALGAGVFAAIADGFMLAGVRLGELSIMAVLVALYSGVTVILAALILKERITRIQGAGLICALAAVTLLAAA